MRSWTLLTALIVACGPPPDLVDESACLEPEVWFPDEDGDRVGELTGSYFGCNPPQGWVKETVKIAPETPTGGTGAGGSGINDTAGP